MLIRTDKKMIEQTVKEIKKIKGVLAILLFGSYARGEQKPLSDIDICVLTGRKVSERIKSEIVSHSSNKVDISIFWDLPAAIRYSALKEGKILFNKDEEYLHDATVKTMSEYLDFKYIIDRNLMRVFGK